MRPAGPLALAALVHLAPEHIARWLRQSHAAWEAVLFGVEAMILWLVLGAAAPALVLRAPWAVAVQASAAWGAVEGGMRAGCRLAFPMDRPPPRPAPGENLCDLATGWPASWLSLVAALFVACVAQEASRGTR